MNRGLSTLWALGIGAGLMYFLDPQVGNRRRSLVRDQANSLVRQSDRFIEKTTRDFRNRAQGVLATTSAKLTNPGGTRNRAQEPGSGFLVENWSPTARLLSGTGGLALTAYGLGRKGIPGTALSLLGLGLATRGITNQRLNRLLGFGPARNAVEIHKAININAPVEEVYRFWENAENFPRFMEHVKEIWVNGDIYHWTVAGPAGTPVEFETVVTRREPNRVLAWKSRPDETVKSAGIVQFHPNSDGSTRVTVRMSYTPPAGALGHAVAALFGVDPKHAMDDDLARLKTLLETGKTTAEGKRVTKEEVSG